MKKLLALAIVFSLFYGIKNETSLAWFWSEESQNSANTCEKLNKCGRYSDVDCAISDLRDSLPVTGYKELNEIGQKCEYSIYMWTYKGLDTFPIIMARLLEEAQRGSKRLCAKPSSKKYYQRNRRFI